MVKFICNKLSRDKTLVDMKNNGVIATHIILDKKSLRDALNEKLIEECHEVKDATDRTDVIDELGDVFEVIDGLCRVYGITRKEIAAAQRATRIKRGGIKKGYSSKP